MRSDRKSEAARPAELRYCYEWPRPGVTVDIALFTVAGALNDLRLQVLLIERDEPPWRCMWALPGGFVRENEDLDAAALRELHEETGIPEARLEQVEAVGTPGRDTRGHVITVVYVGLAPAGRHQLAPRGDARAARWFDLGESAPLPPLAFDHAELLQRALLPPAPPTGRGAGLLRPAAGDVRALGNAGADGGDPRPAVGPPQLPTQGAGGGFRGAGGGDAQPGRTPAGKLFRFVPEAFARRERPLPF